MKESKILDLIVLVPGADEREAIQELLHHRRESLGIKELRFDIKVHPRRDPGCLTEAPDVLQVYASLAQHALVIFDLEGSGAESKNREVLEADLRDRLSKSGWTDRAEVIVIEPEFDVWAWSSSPHLDEALGWKGRSPALRDWLLRKQLWPEGSRKPPRPKEALQAALRESRVRRSASVYRVIAEKVGIQDCREESFLKFRSILTTWFEKNH